MSRPPSVELPGPRARRLLLVTALVAAVSALTLGAVAPLAPASAAEQRRVVDDGHLDIGPKIENGQWRIQARDDTVSPPVWRELDEIALAVGDDVRIELPADQTYAFLGKPGDQVWVLPQVQRAGVVWPGWNTQDPSVVSGVAADVTWTVQDVKGPGRFWLFVSAAFGAPTVVFDGAKPWPQSTAVPRNVHAHGNWAFDAPGLYRLTMTMAGRSARGASLTDTRTLVIAVGPQGRSAVPATGSGAVVQGVASPSPGQSGGGDPAGQGNGSDALDAEGGQLPNTGAGYLPALAGGAVLVMAMGLVLRRTARRRPARDLS